MKKLLAVFLLLSFSCLRAQDTLRLTSESSGSFELITIEESDQQTDFTENSYTGADGSIVTTLVVAEGSERKINLQTRERNNLTIYPNPGKGVYNIVSGTAINKVEVFSPLGEMVQAAELNGAYNPSVDISFRPNGVYFFKISFSDGSRRMSKVVKQ
jgi:hypothetical protein